MAKEFKVRAANMSATYNAGRFTANSEQEAIEMAREEYRNSSLGRSFKDVRAFRFFVVDKFDYEEDEEDEED